ncbi:MAG: hypothetical protein WC254_00015 [Candidatus Woesearchaeota archaeon]|jgi:hypothetical protein
MAVSQSTHGVDLLAVRAASRNISSTLMGKLLVVSAVGLGIYMFVEPTYYVDNTSKVLPNDPSTYSVDTIDYNWQYALAITLPTVNVTFDRVDVEYDNPNDKVTVSGPATIVHCPAHGLFSYCDKRTIDNVTVTLKEDKGINYLLNTLDQP